MGHWADRDSYSWFRSWSRLRKFSRTSWDREAKVIRRKASETNGGSVGTVTKSYKQKDPGIFKLQNTFEAGFEPIGGSAAAAVAGPEYIGSVEGQSVNGQAIALNFASLNPQSGDTVVILIGHGQYSTYSFYNWSGYTRTVARFGNDSYDHLHYVYTKQITTETSITTPSALVYSTYRTYAGVTARLFLFRNVSTVVSSYEHTASNTTMPYNNSTYRTLASNTGFMIGSSVTAYYSANTGYSDIQSTTIVTDSYKKQQANDTRDSCMVSFVHPVDNASWRNSVWTGSNSSSSYDATQAWVHVY